MYACMYSMFAREHMYIYVCVHGCTEEFPVQGVGCTHAHARTHARIHTQKNHTHTHTPVEQGPEELAVQGIGSEVALLRIIPPREKKRDLLPPPAQLPVTKETKSRESIGQDRSGHVLRRASLVMRHLKGVHGPPVHH